MTSNADAAELANTVGVDPRLDYLTPPPPSTQLVNVGGREMSLGRFVDLMGALNYLWRWGIKETMWELAALHLPSQKEAKAFVQKEKEHIRSIYAAYDGIYALKMQRYTAWYILVCGDIVSLPRPTHCMNIYSTTGYMLYDERTNTAIPITGAGTPDDQGRLPMPFFNTGQDLQMDPSIDYLDPSNEKLRYLTIKGCRMTVGRFLDLCGSLTFVWDKLDTFRDRKALVDAGLPSRKDAHSFIHECGREIKDTRITHGLRSVHIMRRISAWGRRKADSSIKTVPLPEELPGDR